MKFLVLIFIFLSSAFSQNFYYEFGKKVYVTEKKDNRNLKSIKEYTKKDGSIIKFKNEIIVQCRKNNSCKKELKSITHNITQLSKDFYLVKVNKNQNIFLLSQKLYNLASVKLAHPNFIKKRIFR